MNDEVVARLADALWQAFYHGELDGFSLVEKRIDGNDNPIFREMAVAISKRLTYTEMPSCKYCSGETQADILVCVQCRQVQPA